MSKKSKGEKAVRRIRELLVWFFIVTGVLLVIISFIIPPGGIQIIVRSLGLSLAPAAVVTLILSRYAASITEIMLREVVEIREFCIKTASECSESDSECRQAVKTRFMVNNPQCRDGAGGLKTRFDTWSQP